MRHRPTVLTSLALAAALTLSACSGGESEPEPSGSAEETASAEATPAGTELPTVEGGFGEDPTIAFPGGGAPADLQVEVLQSGDGAEVGRDRRGRTTHPRLCRRRTRSRHSPARRRSPATS